MKSKQIITLILLLFVGVSVATLVVKQASNSTSAPENTVDQPVIDDALLPRFGCVRHKL